MKRPVGLLLLLAASVVAGFLLLRSGVEREPVRPVEERAASTAPAAGPTPDTAPSPAPPPAAETVSPPTPSPDENPVVVVDAVRLREEADRLIASGHALEGIELMRQATAANPTAKNHGDLGSLLLRLTAVDEALVHLRQAANLDRRNPDRWVDLANAYYRKVDLGEAWKAERRAREAQPGIELKRGPNGLWLRPGDSASANR